MKCDHDFIDWHHKIFEDPVTKLYHMVFFGVTC